MRVDESYHFGAQKQRRTAAARRKNEQGERERWRRSPVDGGGKGGGVSGGGEGGEKRGWSPGYWNLVLFKLKLINLIQLVESNFVKLKLISLALNLRQTKDLCYK